MLICNNCNTSNEPGTMQCGHCHMEGNFRQQIGDNRSDDTPVLEAKIICRNCGSDAPGELTKCVHCRFPLAKVKTQVSTSQVEQTSLETSAIQPIKQQ